MKKQIAVLFALAMFAVTAALAENPPSKSFKLDAPKALKGTLQDQTEAIIADTEIQLLDSHKKLVKSVKTDAKGQYDFGTLAPGEYKVRLKSEQWNSKPTVGCTGDVCVIAPVFHNKVEEQNPVSF